MRNISDELKFQEHKNNLIHKLKLRAFPRLALRSAREVLFSDRQRILDGEAFAVKQRNISQSFVMTRYNHVRPSLAKTLHTHWLAIESDPKLYSRFIIPPMVSFVRSRSLKTTIKNKKFACPNLISPLSCVPFQHTTCNFRPQARLQICSSKLGLVCPRLLRHTVVRSCNNTLFPIDTTLTCSTEGVIYVLTCMHCPSLYERSVSLMNTIFQSCVTGGP